MKKQYNIKNKKINLKKSPLFLIALFNFLIIILILIYIIYLRFIPYMTITYDGYAVSGKDLANNLLNASFDVDQSIEALEVKDQQDVFKNLKSYYLGADKKKNINLNYPIYVNNTLALYNLSSEVILYTDSLQMIEGYSGFTLTSGALYNANTLERADYHNYILMKNEDGLYINTKEIKIKTNFNNYTIKMNSIINFTDEYITYYSLEDGKFMYGKILDIDNGSKIIIEEFHKKYSYEEFLIGLGIIEENKEVEKETDENNIIEENKVEAEKNEEKNTVEIEEELVQDENKEEKKDNTKTNTEIKWEKPVVSCKDFEPNVYTATTEIRISDPNRVINKAITFTFYIDGEISFRSATVSTGEFKVTKLLPNTKYKVIGTYQYKNEEENIIEVKFLDQEFKTLDTKNIKPIDLSLKNGKIYSNKIELQDLRISSDITDEAIYGVSKAVIEIEGVSYPISTQTLKSILEGNEVNYQLTNGIMSNSKYKYEIKFYDTANNEMKLTNNTGSTHTSKEIPTVIVNITKQNITSIELELTLNNLDDVKLKKYKYIIYTENGEICKKGNLKTETNNLYFDDLDPSKVYTIEVYADFDIEDGNGILEEQLIGSAKFTTESLSKLGSLKLDVEYEEKDLTYNSMKFTTKINEKTDYRLIKILTEVIIDLQDEEGNSKNREVITDINNLNLEGYITEINELLNSNTTYYIVITAKASQGNVEEEITTTYTLNSFTTNKAPASMNVEKLVVTTNLIDFDLMVYDKDGTSLDGTYVIELRDQSGYKVNSKEINSNEYTRCTYEDLNEGEKYILICYAKEYNETNDIEKVKLNYEIKTVEFTTTGLEGNLDLTGLMRKNNNNSKNLIDVKSNNNWYSQCFDVLEKGYENNEKKEGFYINPTKNYGKEYNSETKELILTSSQCYVYNFKEYAGKKVTMSFKAKVSNDLIEDGIYIQKGKILGENCESITDISTEYKRYEKTLDIPEDGYLGFYLSEECTETLTIKELQIELGENATEYQDYTYDLKANIKTNFEDDNYITSNENEEKSINYYIKFTDNNSEEKKEYKYNEKSNKVSNEVEYNINATSTTIYKVQLIIKVYEREYILDEISFEYNPETCYEIKSISSKDEFRDIQPYGNYILLENIKLTDAKSVSENTFGNPNISFYGSIDFNGKTISKDLYSNELQNETTPYVFYKLEKNAKLKNIVLNVYIDDNYNERFNIDEEDGIYPLFLYNNGTIDNIMVELKRCGEKGKKYVSLMGYRNEGTIENFIINFDKTFYGDQYISSVVLYSNGTIQNGYIYGEGIKATSDIAEYGTRNIAGVVYEVQDGGIVQNIYNLAQITINHQSKTDSYAVNIAYEVAKGANVRNVYSLKEIITIYNNKEYTKLLDRNNKEVDAGPNIYTSSGNVQFSYYFCSTNYGENAYNIKQDGVVLNDYSFQENLLNANGCSAFIVQKYVKNGYYPQLNLNTHMPTQQMIKIDIDNDNEIMDLLSAKIVEYDTLNEEVQKSLEKLNEEIQEESEKYDFNKENIHIGIFNIYNPTGRNITEININYISNVKIVYQNYENKMSTVYAVLTDATSFIDEYYISSIKAKDITGKEYKKNYDIGKKLIKVSFIKHITNAEEWSNIDNDDTNGVSGLIQNYKLDIDINFGEIENTPFILGEFKGTLNGQGHTLSNIKGKQCLFKTVSGSLKNINIQNYIIETSNSYIGIIEEIKANSVIDNIHVINEGLNTTNTNNQVYIGGIAGYVDGDNVTIKNCSVTSFEIDMNKTATNHHCIGGLVGRWDAPENAKLTITNSFVQKININSKNTVVDAIGGIIGYVNYNNETELKIQYCYTEGNIQTDKPYVGGIFGRITSGYTRTGNQIEIKCCYSIVNIKGNMTTGDECIGGIGGACTNINTQIYNNLYLGNIYAEKDDIKYSNRIVGYCYNTKLVNNYGYKNQFINNKVSEELYGANGLLSYEEIFNEETYMDSLDFGTDNYNYDDLPNYILPKLLDTYRKLLPNQKGYSLNELKVTQIDYDYCLYNTESEDVTDIENNDDANAVKITLKFEGISNVEFKDFIFEDNALNIKKMILNKEDNIIKIIAMPERYYDSYRIIKMKYKDNNQTEKTLESSIKISTPFYKTISNAEEWNKYTNTEYAENYKIVGNIDFEEVATPKINVLAIRIIADSPKTISNLNLEFSEATSGLIKEITTEITNIDFNNIEIKGKDNSIGIIYKLSGKMENCNFENIKITAENYSYIGIISNCVNGSSMNNVNIGHIEVLGKNYIGGLVGKATDIKGNFNNIKGVYLKVTGKGEDVGGIFGMAAGNGKLTKIYAYQYSEDGKKENDEETDYLVSGNSNIGGCVGYVSMNVDGLQTKNSKIKATGDIIGGCIGYKHTGSVNNMISENNEISGKSKVGGILGVSGVSMKNLTSQSNKISGTTYVGGCVGISGLWNNLDTITSTDNTISGITYIGGCFGKVYNDRDGYEYEIKKIESSNNICTGTSDYVGGVAGYSDVRIINAKAYKITAKGENYVGGMIGQHTYDTQYYYAVDGASISNSTITGANNVGGYSGYQNGTVYAVAIDESTINATNKNAGGITGYYIGSSKEVESYITYKNYDIMHSFCNNSTITSNNNAGGLIGYFVFGNIQYCYIGNTNIQTLSENAGGLVGYFNNEKMSSKQYVAEIKYNFIANTEKDKKVTSNTGVGGIIGTTYKNIYVEKKYNNNGDISSKTYYIEFNLITTDIESNDNYVSMGIGKVDSTNFLGRTESLNMNKIYVYDCSYINGEISTNTNERGAYELLSYADLSIKTTYTNVDGLNFGDSSERFIFNNGYFPKLNTLTGIYWDESNLNVKQEWIEIPNRENDILETESTSTVSLESYSLLNIPLITVNQLPDIYTYSTDVDKINIEFSEISSNLYFDIKTTEGEVILESQPITERVYTLKYNFKTDLIVTVSNLSYWYTETINKESVQNLLDIQNDEYFYISDNQLYSSKRNFEGEYINLYNGKALSVDGSIYDILTMELLDKNEDKIKLLDIQIPLAETEYEGIKIQTYYHCSKVIQENKYIYKDQQIFIKNGTMYLADGDLDSIGNSIIIDSYNNKQYETILGTDGVMYDLLNEINYPKVFKNENIIAMTNNINNNNNVVLVYYSTGKVYGFNYITGEEIYDNNVGEKESFVSYIMKNLSLSNLLYETDKSSYKEAQELTEKLEHISIDEALEEITGDNIQEEIEDSNTYKSTEINQSATINKDTSKSKDINEKYITTYDAKTQNYVVYSTSELLTVNIEKTQSENEKINNNGELISYYTNISTSKINLKNIGIIIFATILLTICSGLVIMYNKRNR